MDELFQYLDSLYPLTPEIKASLINCCRKETYRNRKALLSAGQFCDWMAFIEKGLVKVCYDVPGGQERIIYFNKPGEITTAIKSFHINQPSKLAIISLGELIIRKMPKIEIEAICEKHPVFNIHYRKMLEVHFNLIEDHFLLLTLPVRERIKKLGEDYGWVIREKQIKDYHIADFLGIDKATLSRAKRDLNKF